MQSTLRTGRTKYKKAAKKKVVVKKETLKNVLDEMRSTSGWTTEAPKGKRVADLERQLIQMSNENGNYKKMIAELEGELKLYKEMCKQMLIKG